MKTLYLDVVFNTDCKYGWELIPIGTKNEIGKYEYEDSSTTWADDTKAIQDIISGYKKVLKAFQDNVLDNDQPFKPTDTLNIVKDTIQKALDADWSKDFCITNYIIGCGSIFIKFHIQDDKKPYTFYVTEDEKELLNKITRLVFYEKSDEEFELLKADELREATMHALIRAYLDSKTKENKEL